MSNFCYIAFAFNRISLIGKDHSKLVEFISKVSFKKYLLLTGLISVGLSVVKSFKYRVNYDHSELNYPFNIENDLNLNKGVKRNVYFVANFISDLLNYVIFAIINIAIDVFMVVRLRRTLNEKLDRLKSIRKSSECKTNNNAKKSNNKNELDINEALNNAIRMVVINSGLNFFFKLLLVYIPLQNVIAAFYYKSKSYEAFDNSRFDSLMGRSYEMDLFALINESADWLYNLLIAVQFFVYLKFDKKLKDAFDFKFRSSPAVRGGFNAVVVHF